MSNEKLKSENYQLLGGINSKISLYQNTPLEFLDIKNFDFQTPNALTQRWGSTQYMSQSFGSPIQAIYEYSKLDGSSFIFVGHTGGVWFGATTGQSQGASFTGFTSTISVNAIQSSYQFLAAGLAPIVREIYPYGSTFYGKAIYATYTFTYSYPGLKNGTNLFSARTINNQMYSADGDKFWKFNGATTSYNGLLPPVVVGSSCYIDNAATFGSIGIPLNSIPFTGNISYFCSYVNNAGFESQIWPVSSIDLFPGGYATFAPLNGSFISHFVDLYTPTAFGISTINVYAHAGATVAGYFPQSQIWNPAYVYQYSMPASGGETTRLFLGKTADGFTALTGNVGNLANLDVNLYYPFGGITISAGVFPVAVGTFNMLNPSPRYLETYQNRMFAAGFSTMLSTVYFSDPIVSEGYRVDSNFEVRTNDSDYITAIKSYGTRMYIFKKGSFHCLIGDSPSNFSLQEVSLNYGCMNNRCVVVYEQIMLFLDRKGVMIYNGASLDTLSNKVQPIFDRMNYSAALDVALMVHDKLRNQVLIAIPVDGSTTNNLTVVYDYLAQAWTTYNGFIPSAFERAQGRNNTKNVFYGTPSGVVNWFGPSMLGDNSVGFTTYFKTRFLHDLGESIEKQFRRLYLNMDTGTTFVIPINFYQDYGSSTVYAATMVLNEFQKRIDYGIPAKSLAFEIFNLQTNSPLKIYGFTIESRFQRKT